MEFVTALTLIADQLSLDPYTLETYALEDSTIGGYHSDPKQAKWISGSLWQVEGKILYALIRTLKPMAVLELGVHVGASTTHLRAAIEANGYGYVTSIDKWEGAGAGIPARLASHGKLVFEDALTYIASLPDNTIDFVFEDLIHSESEVYDVITALRPKLRKGAVVVHHDSEHGDDGEKVRAGIRQAGVTGGKSYAIEPSDCGLGIWRHV